MVANGYCRSNGHHAFMTKYHQLFIGSLCLFLNLGRLAFVRAQAPVLTINMAYTSIDEKTLYIQGGTDSNSSKTTSQFYSLDLTQTGWSTSNPPWKALNSQQAPLDYSHSMVVSGDKQSLIVWGSLTNISTYNISADTWSTTAMPVYATKKLNGLRAVEDPTTGSIYIPSGSNQGLNMMGYSPSQGTFQNLTIPTSLTQGVTHYSAAWTNSGNSFLMYGGYFTIYPNETVTTLYQYSASNSTWTAITTSGVNPGAMDGHCLVSAYNGTKMVLFGGQTSTRQPLPSIYILDVQSWTWTKGVDIDTLLRRNGMACSVSGDFFIAWGGGLSGTFVSVLQTPVIYDLKNNKWTTTFGPTSTSNAAIIGGAVAGVVVILVIAFLVFRRFRSSRKKSNLEPIELMGNDSKTFTPFDFPSRKHNPPNCLVRSPQGSDVFTKGGMYTKFENISELSTHSSPPAPTLQEYRNEISTQIFHSIPSSSSPVQSLKSNNPQSFPWPEPARTPRGPQEIPQDKLPEKPKSTYKSQPHSVVISDPNLFEMPFPQKSQPHSVVVTEEELLERQIAEIKAQSDLRIRQQQELERLRLNEQAQLEMLEQQLNYSRTLSKFGQQD